MRTTLSKPFSLTAILGAAALSLAACEGDAGTDGVIEGEEYPEPVDAVTEAPPAQAAQNAEQNAADVSQYPELGAGSLPEGEIGNPDAEPGQDVEDADVNAGLRASE